MVASSKRGPLPLFVLAALLSFAAAWAGAEVAVPPLKSRVTDLASTLSQDQRAALEQKLAALEARKGSQVAVLLVPTTQPETVEQYAIRVFDQWKLGRKGVDDGVLLLIAKNDRKLRIEVGRGLEGAIPDAFAKRIIDEEITPRFKQGDFHGGISAGVDRIVKLVDGEPMPPPAKQPARQSPSPISDWSGEALFYGLFALLVLAGLLKSLLGRLLGSGVTGIASSILIYLLAGLGFALIAGILIFVISLLLGGTSRVSGWSSGGSGNSWSSGGSSWSSSSGGGFSGGGGSSGGGGASGSW